MWECGSDRKGQKVNKGYGLAKKLSGSFIHLFKIINASWRNSRTKYIVTKCEGSEVLPYLYAIKLACHRFILMEAGRRQGWGQRNVSLVAQLAPLYLTGQGRMAQVDAAYTVFITKFPSPIGWGCSWGIHSVAFPAH